MIGLSFVIVFGLIGVLGAQFAKTDARLLTRILSEKTPHLMFLAGIAGFVAGLAKELGAANDPRTGLSKGLNTGLLQAGAAVFAVVTLAGGSLAVGRFTGGSKEPQAIFVGSGTVHRFLFSDSDGLELPLGVPLGPSKVRLWGLEGESSDGVEIAAYSYVHRSETRRASEIPLIGMASFNVIVDDGDPEAEYRQVGTLLKDRVERHLIVNDINQNRFLVLPLLSNLEISAYVRQTSDCRFEEVKYWDDGGPHLWLGRVQGCQKPPSLFTGRRGSGTAATQKTSSPERSDAGRHFTPDQYWNGSGRYANYSLDLQHLIDEEVSDPESKTTTLIATGNFDRWYPDDQIFHEGWKRLPTGTRRDLILVVPLKRSGASSRIPYNACLAIHEVWKGLRLWDRLNSTVSRRSGDPRSWHDEWKTILDADPDGEWPWRCVLKDEDWMVTGSPDWPSPEDPVSRASRQLKYPVAYLDMDGTTLTSDHRIPKATLRALEEFRGEGGLVGIATGRTLEQVTPFLAELNPDLPLVLYNGAVTYSRDGKSIVRQARLSAQAVDRLLKVQRALASEHRVCMAAQFVDGRTIAELKGDCEGTFASMGITAIEDCALTDCLSTGKNIQVHERPAKVLIVSVDRDPDAVARRTNRILGETSHAIVTDPRRGVVEVIAPEANKASAISAVVEELGFDLEDVMVFGDSQNDVEMLLEAGLGIAMGNCHPSACAAALCRTDDHDSDAIARIFDRVSRKR